MNASLVSVCIHILHVTVLIVRFSQIKCLFSVRFHFKVRVKMNRMRLRIAQRLKDAQNTYAMLTTFNEVDMRLARRGERLFKMNTDEIEKSWAKINEKTKVALNYISL